MNWFCRKSRDEESDRECQHLPMKGLSKEPRTVMCDHVYPYMPYTITTRTIITEHICRFCKCFYADVREVDEEMANLGPLEKKE